MTLQRSAKSDYFQNIVNNYRKPPNIVYIVYYHGTGNSNPTIDFLAVWPTRQSAEQAILRYKPNDAAQYSVEPFVSCDVEISELLKMHL